MRAWKYALAAALAVAGTSAQAKVVDFGQGAPAATFADGTFSVFLSGNFLDGFYPINGGAGAFNGYGQNGETIFFNKEVTLNSLKLGKCEQCGDFNPLTFTVSLFDGASSLLTSQTIAAVFGDQLLSFNTMGVRQVQFTFTGGGDAYGDGRTVAWYQASDVTYDAGAVPEPAAWATMLAGFAMVGAARRRRFTLHSPLKA